MSMHFIVYIHKHEHTVIQNEIIKNILNIYIMSPNILYIYLKKLITETTRTTYVFRSAARGDRADALLQRRTSHQPFRLLCRNEMRACSVCAESSRDTHQYQHTQSIALETRYSFCRMQELSHCKHGT